MNFEELLQAIAAHRTLWHKWLHCCQAEGRAFLLQSDLQRIWQRLGEEGANAEALAALSPWIAQLQEACLDSPAVVFAHRPRIGEWRFYYCHTEQLNVEKISCRDFLAFKERIVAPAGEPMLEVDFTPFNRGFPRLKESRSIGNGVIFLNRQLASRLIARPEALEEKLLNFLALHAMEGQALLTYRAFPDAAALRGVMRQAVAHLEKLAPDTPWGEFAERLRSLGLAPGWGDCASRAIDTLSLLQDVMEGPSPEAMEAFLARIPMISRLLILSPHGYFGQSNVLGRPDTGGQVVYILDQVRALEAEMKNRLAQQGVAITPKIVIVTRLIPEAEGTTCDQRLEKVHGTDNSWILRVPFRHENGEIHPRWISRFEVWPYLERFAQEAGPEVVAELGGRPDLIIGNYSDGNLVASLLSRHMGVTQCNIAHALEKTKYLLSDLYWKDMDAQYHFGCQYTADLISMNSADFIITSTYQEIAGTRTSIGQYEGYTAYTLPGLYRVSHGIDLYDPKFNIVSPGADASVYFPYHKRAERFEGLHEEIEQMLYGDGAGHGVRGNPGDAKKIPIFTMARLDRIKNVTGLVRWFGEHAELRNIANLIVVGGYIDPNDSADEEERAEIGHMHRLIDELGLENHVRWIGGRLDKLLTGELYRFVADRGGVFVQPALFEAFGLTVVEAMACGLPVFATRYGGPLEIIEDGRSGFHIDPNDGAAGAERIFHFLQQSKQDPTRWQAVSDAAIARVNARYTWARYAERMMTLARIYGFWKFVNNLEREETQRYLEMFYHLMYRPLARAVPLS
ncbi:MAG: sucrose synthase [Pseudomonadota bacterium]